MEAYVVVVPIVLLLVCCGAGPKVSIAQTTNLTSVYAYGDSLLDAGNNNDFPNNTFSIARANHTPYGRIFDTHTPTGRFTDGEIFSDFIASYYNLSFPCPYRESNCTGNALKNGVNFASGGAAILDSASANLTPYNMSEQLRWLQNVSQRLAALEGSANAAARLAGGLHIFSLGSNDFSQRMFNLQTAFLSDSQFLSLIISSYKQILTTAYNIGARKFLVFSLGPLGCTPIALTMKCGFNTSQACRSECNESTNNLAYQFDLLLNTTLTNLQSQLSGSRFYYSFDNYNVTYDAIKNPSNYGFLVVDRGCCGTGLVEIGDGCNANTGACLDGSKFLFFDAIHPSTQHDSYLLILKNKSRLPLAKLRL